LAETHDTEKIVISLQNRLTLTYALFISAALGVLTLVVNQFTGLVFAGLIRENINEKSGEIVRSIGELYNPLEGDFDVLTVETMGMYFVHEGYIVSVRDGGGGVVWDARSCDMEQCSRVISGITERMERRFGRSVNGGLQSRQYPVLFNGAAIGEVTIETYGPFFYSETESRFLTSINRLLLLSGIVFILLSIVVSAVLSGAIARPILRAGEAARKIAARGKGPHIRIHDRYKTRELAELSRSINELARELEEGERRQKQLSADIAHELRTPLTCLQGSIEAMIDGVWEADAERLKSCHEEVIRLTKLVEDLNILTGLEWNEITLNKTDFDLARLLQSTAEQFYPAAAEKGIAIHLDLIPSPINADYDRLKQVFINLLSNAVKYAGGGSVGVSIRKGADASSAQWQWDVVVADTGPGIPPDEIPRVFERFYRSDKSRNRGTGGAGIGLTIAAAIVAAHGGSIAVENRPAGDGSTGAVFTVRV
jgi:signal transduction histidine kinase